MEVLLRNFLKTTQNRIKCIFLKKSEFNQKDSEIIRLKKEKDDFALILQNLVTILKESKKEKNIKEIEIWEK